MEEPHKDHGRRVEEGNQQNPNISKSSKKDGRIKHNTDGGKTNFYNLPEWVVDVDDIAKYLGMNYDEGCCLKALFGISIARKTGVTRHKGTSAMRDANKLLHYAQRIKADHHG